VPSAGPGDVRLLGKKCRCGGIHLPCRAQGSGDSHQDERGAYRLRHVWSIQNQQYYFPSTILEEWRKKGYDPDTLKIAFADQPYFEKEAAENMLNLFEMLCKFIVSQNYIRFRHINIAGQVVRYIEEHISESVSLSEVAKHIGYSESTISHAVKPYLGLSFKHLRILMKIEHFEKFLAVDPNLSIEEAAFRVGYDDPSYFCRVYKKVRSATPSAYSKSIRMNKVYGADD
jgi:AraC-like DNA-binding protein